MTARKLFKEALQKFCAPRTFVYYTSQTSAQTIVQGTFEELPQKYPLQGGDGYLSCVTVRSPSEPKLKRGFEELPINLEFIFLVFSINCIPYFCHLTIKYSNLPVNFSISHFWCFCCFHLLETTL